MSTETIDRPVSIAFMLVAVLADLIGVKSIKDLDDCWECAVDAQWKIAVNGHGVPIDFNGVKVLPFCMAIEMNGIAVGHLTPFGGVLMASEDDFIVALARRVRRETDDGEYPTCVGKAFKESGLELPA